MMDGEGVFKWKQGHEYRGSFRDGQMDGQGEFTHSNGSVMTGKFKRSLFDQVGVTEYFATANLAYHV